MNEIVRDRAEQVLRRRAYSVYEDPDNYGRLIVDLHDAHDQAGDVADVIVRRIVHLIQDDETIRERLVERTPCDLGR